MIKERYFGVIGGMGSKATLEFYERLIESSKAEKDQDHMNVLILNHATLPDRTEVILENREEDFLSSIENDFKIMESSGVTDIAIPCNSAHFFFDKMQKMTKANIINMIDETGKEIKKNHGKGTKIGLLATDGTVKSGIYKKYCDKHGFEIILPNETVQKDIMDVIYSNIKGHMELDSSLLDKLIEQFVFEENCQCVIIGCTELSCIKVRDDLKKYVYDAMDVLVNKSIALYQEY